MTQEWDDILSEPMAQLQPDLTAAEGGWRAVRSIDEVSPRPQQPPLTLPEPDGMLSIRLPGQPEEATPSSAPPPPSLTNQLSLTWTGRRRRRRRAAEEVEGESWPAWDPAPQDEEEPEGVQPTSPALSWLKPLRSLVRLLRGDTRDERQEQEPMRKAPVGEQVPAAATRPSAIREAPAELPRVRPAPRLTLEGENEVPLTLATLPSSPATEETAHDSISTPKLEAAPLRQSPPEAEAQSPPATRSPDNVLRRWLARKSPDEVLSKEPVPVVQTDSEPEPSSPPVTLVTRRERAGEHRDDDRPEESTAETHSAPLSIDREEGLPLTPVLRERMEKLLDVPLKEVRVFRNEEARQVTKTRRADALTAGTKVHLAPGRGNPSTPSGQALIAHELSHVAARIAGRPEPVHQEERHAQAIEHALKSQPELAVSRLAASRQAAIPAPPLQHRAQPRNVATSIVSAAQPGSYSGGGFAGGASGGPSSAPTAAHAAPVGRIPAIADLAMSGGRPGFRSDAGGDERPDSNEPDKDEPGGVDRIVEAVMRRLRREGSFERERRGSFRSEIGG